MDSLLTNFCMVLLQNRTPYVSLVVCAMLSDNHATQISSLLEVTSPSSLDTHTVRRRGMYMTLRIMCSLQAVTSCSLKINSLGYPLRTLHRCLNMISLSMSGSPYRRLLPVLLPLILHLQFPLQLHLQFPLPLHR